MSGWSKRLQLRKGLKWFRSDRSQVAKTEIAELDQEERQLFLEESGTPFFRNGPVDCGGLPPVGIDDLLYGGGKRSARLDHPQRNESAAGPQG